MDAMKEFQDASLHDTSVIKEVKALTEKLNMMTQASSTRASLDHTHIEPTMSDDHDDNASEFSGYSVLTPSAASKSEPEDEKLPLDQQIYAEELIDMDGESRVPEVNVSALDFEDDFSNSQQNGKGRKTTRQPQEEDIDVVQSESESVSQKRRLVGIVITFEHGVNFDEGQVALRFVGEHLGLSLGSQAKEVRVLAIEGTGHLEVSTPPYPELDLDSRCLCHEAVELVAKIHRVDESCRQEDTMQEMVTEIPSHDSSCFPPHVEAISAPARKTDRKTLLFHRIELAKARTLQALIGPSKAACTGNCLDVNVQEVVEKSATVTDDSSPTLSQLIDVAKTNIRRKLTTNERRSAVNDLQQASTEHKDVKTKRTKSTKKKCTSHLACEKSLLIAVSMLLLTAILLVLRIAEMSTARRGHCVGLWLGS